MTPGKRSADAEQEQLDIDTDHFPTFAKGLHMVAQDDRFGSSQIRRIDIRFDPRGGAVYRVWEGRDRDYTAGAVSAPSNDS